MLTIPFTQKECLENLIILKKVAFTILVPQVSDSVPVPAPPDHHRHRPPPHPHRPQLLHVQDVQDNPIQVIQTTATKMGLLKCEIIHVAFTHLNKLLLACAKFP